MANVRQISVFLDNKPNQLTGVMKLLKENGINLRALSIADTKDFGILRMIANDTDKTVDILKSGFICSNCYRGSSYLISPIPPVSSAVCLISSARTT